MFAKLSKEKFLNLVENIKEYVDLFTLEEGLEQFKKCRLKAVQINGDSVQAQVRDYQYYTATIDVNDFLESYCTCGAKDFCSHLAAVFFYLYSSHRWPDTFLAEAKEHRKQQAAKKTVELLDKTTVKKPLPKDSVEAWHHYFELVYGQMINLHEHSRYKFLDGLQYYLVFSGIYEKFQEKMFSHSSGWPVTLREIFRLHSVLFLMDRLEKIIRTHQWFSLTASQPAYCERCEQELLNHIPKITIEQKEVLRPFLQKILETVQEHYFQPSQTLFDWRFIHGVLWGTILYHPALVERETAFLKRKLLTPSPDRYKAGLGLVFFKVLENEDAAARSILQELDNLRVRDLFEYLSSFRRVGDWQRLLEWLRWLLPRAEHTDRHEFEILCEYWNDAAGESGVQEEALRVLKTWLPRSRRFYADLLLQLKLYRDWVELNILYASDSADISPADSRLLENKDPAALLPLYHQWAARLIESKNRKSYQEAVKLLKKLRSLYKKLKLGREWDEFINYLAAPGRILRLGRAANKGTSLPVWRNGFKILSLCLAPAFLLRFLYRNHTA